MAFTRSNTGQTSSFTRSGATSFVSTPNFQVFSVTDSPSSFSLSNNWIISTESGSSPKLNFKYNGNTILEVTSTGISNATFPYLRLNTNNTLPTTVSYNAGDLINKQGSIYVLFDDGNQSD
jgi:hypothetical protein